MPLAIAVPLIWLGWLVLTDWVPMFPLNDLERIAVRDRAVAAAANYPIPLLIAGGIAWGEPWSLVAATALSGLCLVGHLVNWWLPYVGVSTASIRDTYRRCYSRTPKVLPAAGHDVVLDVQHLVVGLLTAAMVGTTLGVTLGA